MLLSMDAPQQGANVPAAYQHLARHAKDLYLRTGFTAAVVESVQFLTNNMSPYRVLTLSERPASKQMLINYVNGSGIIDNTVHNQWQTELKNLGYPSQNNIRNIAISNGTECGTTQPYGPGAEILNINGKGNTRFLGDIFGMSAFPVTGLLIGQPGLLLGVLPGRNEIKIEIIANAQPSTGVSQRIYWGKISYTKKVLWVIPISVTLTDRSNNSNTSLLPYDYYGGGEIFTIDAFSTSFQNALAKFNMSFSNKPTFCFIPTPSALDIGFNNVALTNTDYLARYIGGAPPALPKNSPFVNFVTAFNNQFRNEQHIGFFTRNGNWLAQELSQTTNPPANPPISNCSFGCGGIQGPDLLCTSSNYSIPGFTGTGASITWGTSPAGIAVPNPINSNPTTLTKTGVGSVTLSAFVSHNNTCPAGVLLTKLLYAGTPPIPTITHVNYNKPCGTFGEAYCTSVTSADSYVWTFDFGDPQTNAGVAGNYFYKAPLNPASPIGTSYYHYLSVQSQNMCGTSASSPLRNFTVGPISSNCGGGGPLLIVAPNPADSDLKLVSADGEDIRELRIIDKMGNIKKQLRLAPGTKRTTVNIGNFSSDIYTVQVYDGVQWKSVKFSKQ